MTNQYCGCRADAQCVHATAQIILCSGSTVTKCVARLNLAGREAALEPGAALRCRAVCKGLGVDAARRRALDAIVADSGGGVQALLDVALLQEATLFGGVSPNTGETVRLELEPNGYSVRVARIFAL